MNPFENSELWRFQAFTELIDMLYFLQSKEAYASCADVCDRLRATAAQLEQMHEQDPLIPSGVIPE